MQHAPLKNWQQDIVSIIRDEAYYFAPQGMTKIMNEGWASYWHSKMMTQDIMSDSEVIDFADAHSGTMAMAPNGFNPYKVGIELFRDIEDRWNRGKFGLEYEQCDNMIQKANWNKNPEFSGLCTLPRIDRHSKRTTPSGTQHSRVLASSDQLSIGPSSRFGQDHLDRTRNLDTCKSARSKAGRNRS